MSYTREEGLLVYSNILIFFKIFSRVAFAMYLLLPNSRPEPVSKVLQVPPVFTFPLSNKMYTRVTRVDCSIVFALSIVIIYLLFCLEPVIGK